MKSPHRKTTAILFAAMLLAPGCGGKAAPKPRPKRIKPQPKPKPVTAVHEIKLDRPVKPGFQYEMTAEGKRTSNVTTTKRKRVATKSGTWEWSYAATVTVKKVTERGTPSREEHEVSKFALTKNGKPTKIPGDPIIIAYIKDGKKRFTIDGKPAKRGIASVLRIIIDLDDGTPNNDARYGTQKRRRVGESWPVNSEAMTNAFASKFKGSKLPLKAENIRGTVTLGAAEQVDGVAKLRLTINAKITDVAPPLGKLTPTAGSMTFNIERWVAQDPGAVDLGNRTKKLSVHIEAERRRTKYVFDIQQQQTTRFTYKKK